MTWCGTNTASGCGNNQGYAAFLGLMQAFRNNNSSQGGGVISGCFNSQPNTPPIQYGNWGSSQGGFSWPVQDDYAVNPYPLPGYNSVPGHSSDYWESSGFGGGWLSDYGSPTPSIYDIDPGIYSFSDFNGDPGIVYEYDFSGDPGIVVEPQRQTPAGAGDTSSIG